MTLSSSTARRAVLRTAAAAAVLALLGACTRKPSFQSTDITGASLGSDLGLTDHNGRPRTVADFKGKVLVVFFGFIQCPDVCPTALAELAQVMQNLGDDAKRVQVAFVTIDPERDSAEIMKEYVTQFHPSFLGLRGDNDATARVAKSFKVYYAKVPGKEPGAYTMDHSAGLYVFDAEGAIRLFARHDAGPDVLTADIRQLL